MSSTPSQRLNYFYLSHGSPAFHRMTLLSLHSLLRLGVPQESIFVMTDSPAFFASSGIQVVPITRALLRTWCGRFNFVHRAKIEALIYFRNQVKGEATMLVDGDTFWTKPVESWERVSMHMAEPNSSPKSMAFYRALLTKGGFYLDQPLHMYNAGLIGLPATFPTGSLHKILNVIDWLCLQAPSRMNWYEQVAVAAELATFGPIQTYEDNVLHYWYQSFEFVRVTESLSNQTFSELTLPEVEAYLVQARQLSQDPRIQRLLWKRKMKTSLGKRVNDLRAAYYRLTGPA